MTVFRSVRDAGSGTRIIRSSCPARNGLPFVQSLSEHEKGIPCPASCREQPVSMPGDYDENFTKIVTNSRRVHSRRVEGLAGLVEVRQPTHKWL